MRASNHGHWPGIQYEENIKETGKHTNVGDNDTEREEVVLVNNTTDRYDTHNPTSFEQG